MTTEPKHPEPSRWLVLRQRFLADLGLPVATLAILVLAVVTSVAASESGADLLTLIEGEETVEAASRHTQRLTDAPARVSIITREEIEKFGYSALQDALVDMTGIFIRDDRNYHYTGVRGFMPFGDYGSHVLIMIDGHPMVEPIFGSSFFENGQPVDLRYVDHIELVRGPASALYGTNAVLAVINIITRKATDYSPFEIGATASSDEGGSLFAGLGHVTEHGLKARIAGSVACNGGFDYYFEEFDNPDQNDGRSKDMDGESTWSVHSHLGFREWSLSALASSRRKTIPTVAWGSVLGDERLRTTDRQGFVDAGYERSLGAQTVFSGHITLDWYSYKGTWPSEADGIIYVEEDPHEGRVLGGEALISSQAVRHNHFIAGLSTKRVVSAKIQAYEAEPEYVEYVNMEKTDNVASVFGQDEISLKPEMLEAQVGIRYDHYERFGGVLNPRFAFIIKSAAGSTKLLCGRSFRAPTLFETYYADAEEGQCCEGDMRANPDLKPERGYTYEIVHEAEVGHSVHAALSAFYYSIDNLISEKVDEDGCIVSMNSGTVRSRGMEVDLRGRLWQGLGWSANYSLTDARDTESADRTPIFPQHLANVRLLVPLVSPRMSLGLSTRYIGSRLTISGNHLPSILLTNVTLRLEDALPGASLSVSVRNIFDQEHLESGGLEHVQAALPQDKRMVEARASWEF